MFSEVDRAWWIDTRERERGGDISDGEGIVARGESKAVLPFLEQESERRHCRPCSLALLLPLAAPVFLVCSSASFFFLPLHLVYSWIGERGISAVFVVCPVRVRWIA